MTMSVGSTTPSRFRSPYIWTVMVELAEPTWPARSWKRKAMVVAPTSKQVAARTSEPATCGARRVGEATQSSVALPPARKLASAELVAEVSPPNVPQQVLWAIVTGAGAVTTGAELSAFTTALVVPTGESQPFAAVTTTL